MNKKITELKNELTNLLYLFPKCGEVWKIVYSLEKEIYREAHEHSIKDARENNK